MAEHWRWGANTTWHYFCSMHYEAVSASNAPNEFLRYHHLRSCIYFSVGVIESFLNQEMRLWLTKQSEGEDAIQNRLKQTRIMEKLSKWPAEMCGAPVPFNQETLEIFDEYRQIRNEITHPKRRDHSIYKTLDEAEPLNLSAAIAATLVTLFIARKRPFPYWALGWNYVGGNLDPALPIELNNTNGFYYSLGALGFTNLGQDITFEQRHMSSLKDFEALREALSRVPVDIEPYWPGFPTKPRLTKRWWDHNFILANYEAACAAAGDISPVNPLGR